MEEHSRVSRASNLASLVKGTPLKYRRVALDLNRFLPSMSDVRIKERVKVGLALAARSSKSMDMEGGGGCRDEGNRN